MAQTRRQFLAQGAGTALAARGAAAANRPNLVYVFADQLRYQSCGYAGDEFARTPNIDQLAARGCNFRQAISSTPVCSAYRSSLFTGKYQSSTGMVINELRLSPEHECFGHVLTRNGYGTAYIGKWHMWANQLGHHDLTVNGFVPPGPYRLGFDGQWAAYNFNHEYYHSPYFENDTRRHVRQGYEPDEQTDTAIQFLRSHKNDAPPFALFLSWGPPHDPWDTKNVPPEYLEKFRDTKIPRPPNYSDVPDTYADSWARPAANFGAQLTDLQRVYYAQAATVDWNLGRIMRALEETGLAGNTILVFTSDHGEIFGAHGRRAKYIFYEEAARIPFLVSWPGRIRKSVSDALLGTPDIMATLLSMMDLPVPRAAEGIDLSRQVFGQGGAGPEAAHMQGMGTTAAWTDGTEWRGLRSHEYTYAVYRRDGKQLLFHNRRDLYQMRNLAGEKSAAATLKHYRDLSARFRKEHNDTFESCTWYRDHWTRDRNITMTGGGVTQNLELLDQTMKKWFPAV
jgi:arylsulfatase A-like enzyme